jgi:hypothetical protein
MRTFEVKFARLPNVVKIFIITPILLLLTAQSCSISAGGGGGVRCRTIPNNVYVSSARVNISGSGVTSGGGGCVTAPRVLNTVRINIRTKDVGVRNTPVSAEMSGGRHGGAPCYFAARWRPINSLSVAIPCNFGTTGLKPGTVLYSAFPVVEWSVNVY